MRFLRQKKLLAAIFAPLLISGVSIAQAQEPMPSVRASIGQLQSPAAAATYYGGGISHTYGPLGYGVSGPNPRPPEIKELARALKNDPDLIFEYVRNTISVNFAYGLQKGAVGTIIDRSGTPFDQAQLLVELFREAGLTASYKLGTITLSGAQFQAWTGLTNAKAACQYLATGGIPATVNGSSDANCNIGGTVTTATISHIWVSAVIGGSSYLFDPSYKAHTIKPRMDLNALLGFTPGTSLSVAMSGAFVQGVEPIAGGNAPWFQSVGQTDLGIYGSTLWNYIKNNAKDALLEDIIGGQTIQRVAIPAGGFRSTSLSHVIATSLTWTGDIPDQYRTTLRIYGTDPSASNATAFDQTLFVDEVYGRRMRIDTNFDWETAQISGGPLFQPTSQSPSSGMTISFTVDGVILQSYRVTIVNIAQRFGRFLDVALVANHPFAATAHSLLAQGTISSANNCSVATGSNPVGSYGDRCVRKRVGVLTPATVVQGWGDVSVDLVGKWASELADDKVLPRQTYSVLCAQSLQSPSSGCGNGVLTPASDFSRDKIAASWLAHLTRMLDIQARVGRGRGQHLNTLGFVFSNTSTATFPNCGANCVQGIPDELTVIDADTTLGITSETADAADRRAAVFSVAAAAAALESAVVESALNLPITLSTGQRFTSANAPAMKVIRNDIDFFTQQNGTWTGDPPILASDASPKRFYRLEMPQVASFAPLLTFAGTTGSLPTTFAPIDPKKYIIPADWKFPYQSAITDFLNTGYSVVGTAESYVGPGNVWGNKIWYGSGAADYLYERSKIRGGAFVGIRRDAAGDPLEVAHIVVSAGGILKGGGSGSSAASLAAFSTTSVTESLESRFTDRGSALGVDLRTGRAGYRTPPALVTGSGGAPFELSALLMYVGGGANYVSRFDKFQQRVTSPFTGFVSNLESRVNVSADYLDTMGEHFAEAAVATIAAAVIAQDTYKSAETSAAPEAKSVAQIAGPLFYDQWQVAGRQNSVSISVGGATKKFVRVANSGIYLPPKGDASTLTSAGTFVSLYKFCGLQLGNGVANDIPIYSHYPGFEHGTLSVADRLRFTLTQPDGTIQKFERWFFDPTGECNSNGGWALSEVTQPTGAKVTFAFDGVYNVASATGSTGRILGHTHSWISNPTPQIGAVAAYGAGGSFYTPRLNITDPQGRSVSYTTSGGVNKFTDLNGGIFKFEYQAPVPRSATQRPIPWPLLTKVYEPVNQTQAALEFTYDTLGRVKEARDAVAIQTPAQRGPHKFYIADGARGEREDPMTPVAGRYIVYYNDQGRPERNIDELGRTVTTVYDKFDRVVSRTYPEGDQELFGYDARHNVTQMTRKAKPASGLADIVVSATWDTTWNKPLTFTDALGRVTTFTYYAAGTAGAGQVKDITRPAAQAGGVQPVTKFEYQANTGLLLKEFQPVGMTANTFVLTTHTYDTLGNRTKTIVDDDQAGYTGKKIKTEWAYTPYGDIYRVLDPRGFLQHKHYYHTDGSDVWNGYTRQLALTYYTAHTVPLLSSAVSAWIIGEKNVYDLNKRVVQKQLASQLAGGVVWSTRQTTTYTPTGKVATVFDPSNDTVTTTYDALDRVYEVTDPAGRKSRTVYDAAGQVVQIRRAVGTPLEQFYATTTYSLNGQPLTLTDARGQITKTIYDGFDRATKVLFPDATPANDNDNLYEQSSYDAAGNVLTKRTRSGQIFTFGYDNLGQLLSRAGGGLPDRLFAYDLGGRRTSVKDMNGAAIVAETQYTYDRPGRVTQERRADWNLNVDYTYDNASNRTELFWPDGWKATYTYDGLNRVDTISASLGGAVRTLRDYDFDLFGRRIRNSALSDGNSATQGATEVVTTYGYEADDDLNQIVHNYPGATADLTLGYGYTPAGQASSFTISETLNRHVNGALGTQSYTGANPLNQYPSVTPIGGALTALTYDLNGNLTGDGSRTYAFDALNRLLSVSGASTASYAHDGLDRRTQKTVAGLVTRFLHAGSDEIGEYTSAGVLLRRFVPGPGPDERAAIIDNATTAPPLTALSFAHADRLGSAMSVTDSAGAVTQRFAYNLWGESNSAATGYPFRYTGQRIDPETGLMFYKARTYSSALGRFLQTDPIGTADDMNMYAYVGNDPANKTDPTGMYGGSEHLDGMRIQTAAADPMGTLRIAGLLGYMAADYYPIVGDIKGAYEFYQAPSLLGGAALAVGLVPILGDAGSAWLKGTKALCCFAAGTPVWTETGLRAIESIKIGDLIWARNEKSGETALKPVSALIPKHERVLWTVSVAVEGSKKSSSREETFNTTDDHPWMLSTGVWVQTKNLARGMSIKRANGAHAEIVAIRETDKLQLVYNLEVTDFHTYFVGEHKLWVHNSNCDWVPEGSFSIIDWAGYPSGLPRPKGPFKMIDGDELKAARAAANSANQKFRRSERLLGAFHVHEIHPLKFGGDPRDPSNKIPLDSLFHYQAVNPWWYKLQKDIEKW